MYANGMVIDHETPTNRVYIAKKRYFTLKKAKYRLLSIVTLFLLTGAT